MGISSPRCKRNHDWNIQAWVYEEPGLDYPNLVVWGARTAIPSPGYVGNQE